MACDWQRQMPPRPACVAWGQPASPYPELEDGASTPVPRVGRGLPAGVPGEKGFRDGSRAPPTHWETAAASFPLSERDAHTPWCYYALYCNPEPPFCSFLLFLVTSWKEARMALEGDGAAQAGFGHCWAEAAPCCSSGLAEDRGGKQIRKT